MSWLSVLGRAVVAFAATNIDDVFVLTLFFAQKNLRRWHVVVGQYVGLAGLITISLAGYFARLLIPHRWIGLLGLAPIAIGIKKLIDWTRERSAPKKEAERGVCSHRGSGYLRQRGRQHRNLRPSVCE